MYQDLEQSDDLDRMTFEERMQALERFAPDENQQAQRRGWIASMDKTKDGQEVNLELAIVKAMVRMQLPVTEGEIRYFMSLPEGDSNEPMSQADYREVTKATKAFNAALRAALARFQIGEENNEFGIRSIMLGGKTYLYLSENLTKEKEQKKREKEEEKEQKKKEKQEEKERMKEEARKKRQSELERAKGERKRKREQAKEKKKREKEEAREKKQRELEKARRERKGERKRKRKEPPPEPVHVELDMDEESNSAPAQTIADAESASPVGDKSEFSLENIRDSLKLREGELVLWNILMDSPSNVVRKRAVMDAGVNGPDRWVANISNAISKKYGDSAPVQIVSAYSGENIHYALIPTSGIQEARRRIKEGCELDQVELERQYIRASLEAYGGLMFEGERVVLERLEKAYPDSVVNRELREGEANGHFNQSIPMIRHLLVSLNSGLVLTNATPKIDGAPVRAHKLILSRRI